jgi:hypothetical protein
MGRGMWLVWRRGEALVGEPEGKNPFGRPMRGWKDNIKFILKKKAVGRSRGLL